MRLARDLGAGSVTQMLKSMPSSELGEWIALYRLEAAEEKKAHLAAKARQKAGAMRRGNR